jgi:hypothetical protein
LLNIYIMEDTFNRCLKIQSLLACEYQRVEKERRLIKRLASKARRELEKRDLLFEIDVLHS